MQIEVSGMDVVQTVGRESYFHILNTKQGFNFQTLWPNESDQNCDFVTFPPKHNTSDDATKVGEKDFFNPLLWAMCVTSAYEKLSAL